MVPRLARIVSLAFSISVLLAFGAGTANAGDKLCPNETDIAYTVKHDETLWLIAARSYCIREWPPLFFAVKTLADYNHDDVGPDPDEIQPSTIVCLPERLTRGKWNADRCADGESGASRQTGVCGNGVREGDEICDGGDVRGLVCENLDLPRGRLACRANCKGFDTTACGNGPSDEGAPKAISTGANSCSNGSCGCVTCCPGTLMNSQNSNDSNDDANAKRRREPSKPLRIRFAVEVTGGVALPLTSDLHDYVYRRVGIFGAGGRVNIGKLELGARGFFLYGDHGTIFNDVEQAQKIIGGGLLLQAGVAFERGGFRFTPGIEGAVFYTRRTITLNDYPFAGQIETQTGLLPAMGIFLRPAYFFGPKKHVNIALDASVDIVLTRLGENDISTNLNTMLLGSVGYAF